MDEQLTELLELGFIKPAPVGMKYNSMIFLILKKDIFGNPINNHHTVIDYHGINIYTMYDNGCPLD